MFKSKKPLVSIVIPCWFTNEQHGKYGKHETFWFATKCLERLLEVTPRESFELIIIDNGSTLKNESLYERDMEDNVNKFAFNVSEFWGEADVLIRNSENLGFAKSCNQAFALTKGEYICCLNNDILVWEKWLDAILELFELDYLNPKVGVVMPALMKETGDAVEALKIDKIDLSKNYEKFGPGAEFGSLWVAPRELLKKIAERRDGYQVFDENFKFGYGGDDRLLWVETRLEGFETYRIHKTRVFHQGGLTMGKFKERHQYTAKNREYLAKMKKEYGVS